MSTTNIVLNPNLPENKIKGVLIDYRTPFCAVEKLNALNIDVFKTAEYSALYQAVNGHPDMVLCHIIDNIFVCEPNFYNYYKSMFPMLNIIKGETIIKDTYPYDIAYNTARVGDYAICNMEYTDNKIIEYLHKKNIKIINVKQGYSKCSVCVVDKHSIITSDKGIAEKTKEILDVLLIEPGYIDLPGVNSGFIGGCSGKISNDILAVCGNLQYHTDCKAITDFCAERNVEIMSLSNEHLFDIGSILPIY